MNWTHFPWPLKIETWVFKSEFLPEESLPLCYSYVWQEVASVCSALEETCLSQLSCRLPSTSPDAQGHVYRSTAVLCGQSGQSSWFPFAGAAGAAARPSAWVTAFWRAPPAGQEELGIRDYTPYAWGPCAARGSGTLAWHVLQLSRPHPLT